MVLARRVLALLAFLLSSPSVVPESEQIWEVVEYSWDDGQSLNRIVVGVNLAITLLVLFSICVCLYVGTRTRANPQETAGPEPAVTQPIVAGSVVIPRVLDQHVIEMFPLLSFQSDKTARFGESDCVICCEEFVDMGNIVRALPCGHIFHPDCIDTWLTSSSTECPVCRHDHSV